MIPVQLRGEENRKTGQISIYPEVQLLVTKIWNHIWRTWKKRNNYLKEKLFKGYTIPKMGTTPEKCSG